MRRLLIDTWRRGRRVVYSPCSMAHAKLQIFGLLCEEKTHCSQFFRFEEDARVIFSHPVLDNKEDEEENHIETLFILI